MNLSIPPSTSSPRLIDFLELERCPHCSIHNPSLKVQFGEFDTMDNDRANTRTWRVYVCGKCGGVVTAYAYGNRIVRESFPSREVVDESLPLRAKSFLQQAIDCIHSPDRCVMLCASAIDEMLKVRGYTEGSLYNRIKTATNEGLLTTDMSQWAHNVRLDANDQRHADVNSAGATGEDAKRCVEFTKTLGELLFVLPARVKRGLVSGKNNTTS